MNPVFRKLLLAGIASAALLSGTSFAADKLPVIASFSILGDLVRVVGGERVSVTTLVGPDEDAHVFEPRPADVKAIAQTRLLVTNGLGFEPWAQKLAKSAGYQGQSVVASQGVKPRQLPAEKGHQHAETDPHAWQDPGNVVLYVRNIAAALAKADPAGASVYQAHSDAYVKELQTLDAWARAQFAALPPPKRQVITSHDAFGYFGAHYQIRFLAPQGVSTDMEPSAKEVARLIQQIQREKIKAVFIENMSAPKLLAQLSKDAGVKVGQTLYVDALSAPQGPAGSYLQLMRHNVTQLAAGMKLN
ncbi:metal ABC transporter substrate-binding protein [Polaromonas sp. CG_9.11]|uniref:metal ABC transporter substrate-binding protein n=1 Tax=Polaromonas sp. CG_9.11 TaxID=2787730 RepID=UPI0018CA4A59|nr:metal ABC transporter substrate-binding protein [Polaromonas sp. CG_9.11]MBG6075149.1 zinc/manganese transport system substrate-binding protein [Polaromonas sp. CG_9.11]